MTYQVIKGSAHNTGLPAKSVHVAVTSPPYFGLRAYDGDQSIEWPTVEYSPMPGLPPIRIQGCEPGCRHEWVDGKTIRQSGGGVESSTLGRKSGGHGMSLESHVKSLERSHFTTTQGAYCIHCGGWRGPLGLEPDINAYIGHLILVLREMWRVLRDDGLLFLNLGDSYSGSGGAHAPDHANPGLSKSAYRDGTSAQKSVGLRPKNLMGVPWRFAFAAQADGWILRNDIIWAKPNPMPESVTDRCTKAHEYIFMLAKQEAYYFDAEAIKEEAINAGKMVRTNGNDGMDQGYDGHRTRDGLRRGVVVGSMRNKRSVWTVATSPFAGAHFACWPEKLVEPMIKAGSSQYGCCPKCGAPWERVVERGGGMDRDRTEDEGLPPEMNGHGIRKLSGKKHAEHKAANPDVTTGWRPTCTCGCDDVVPCVVLDPFAGSGTTLRVALALGRKPVGVDISESYLDELVPERTSNVQMQLAL